MPSVSLRPREPLWSSLTVDDQRWRPSTKHYAAASGPGLGPGTVSVSSVYRADEQYHLSGRLRSANELTADHLVASNPLPCSRSHYPASPHHVHVVFLARVLGWAVDSVTHYGLERTSLPAGSLIRALLITLELPSWSLGWRKGDSSRRASGPGYGHVGLWSRQDKRLAHRCRLGRCVRVQVSTALGSS